MHMPERNLDLHALLLSRQGSLERGMAKRARAATHSCIMQPSERCGAAPACGVQQLPEEILGHIFSFIGVHDKVTVSTTLV